MQQQIDQGGFAGAGRADQADAFARCDGQVDAVQHHGVVADPAVVEMQIFDTDFAAGDLQFGGVRRIGHLARHIDRAHAVLHGADVFEDRGHAAGDPAGDVVQLPGQRNGGGDGGDGDASLRPLPQRDGGHGHDQPGVHHPQRQSIGGGHAGLIAKRLSVFLNRVPHERIFIRRSGEQFHGQDIGIAVHDAPGQHRPHFRHAAGSGPQSWHEKPQHSGIAGKPDDHRQHQQYVEPSEQDQGA